MAVRDTTKEGSAEAEAPLSAELPWKGRVEEPLNRFVHYPLARWVVRGLMRTPITANQITLFQPLLAALAGYLIMLGEPLQLLAAVAVYQVRSLLDCVDGTLARAKKQSSAYGHALDEACDLLSAALLHVGIYGYLRQHPPALEGLGAYGSVGLVVALAAGNGGLRGFAAGYYLRKLGAIFDRGRDEEVEDVRDKFAALKTDRRIMSRWAAAMAWWAHLLFEHERYHPERSRPLNAEEVRAVQEARDEPLTRVVAAMWTVSNGDFWITLTLLGVLLDQVWPTVLFFATAGYLWLILSVVVSGWYVRRMAARARAATA